MRYLIVLLMLSCATSSTNYEAQECPTYMTKAMAESGFVRCRAECASWGRDIYQYRDDCRCICLPKYKAGSNQL